MLQRCFTGRQLSTCILTCFWSAALFAVTSKGLERGLTFSDASILSTRGGSETMTDYRCNTVAPCLVTTCNGRSQALCTGGGKLLGNGPRGECTMKTSSSCEHGDLETENPACTTCDCLWHALGGTCSCTNPFTDVFGYVCAG